MSCGSSGWDGDKEGGSDGNPPTPRDRRLYLEPLEDRRLLSASYTVTNTSADASVVGSLSLGGCAGRYK